MKAAYVNDIESDIVYIITCSEKMGLYTLYRTLETAMVTPGDYRYNGIEGDRREKVRVADE